MRGLPVQDANRNIGATDVALDDVAFVALASRHRTVRVMTQVDGIRAPARLEHHWKIDAVGFSAERGLRTCEPARGDEAGGGVLIVAALHDLETWADVGHSRRRQRLRSPEHHGIRQAQDAPASTRIGNGGARKGGKPHRVAGTAKLSCDSARFAAMYPYEWMQSPGIVHNDERHRR